MRWDATISREAKLVPDLPAIRGKTKVFLHKFVLLGSLFSARSQNRADFLRQCQSYINSGLVSTAFTTTNLVIRCCKEGKILSFLIRVTTCNPISHLRKPNRIVILIMLIIRTKTIPYYCRRDECGGAERESKPQARQSSANLRYQF